MAKKKTSTSTGSKKKQSKKQAKKQASSDDPYGIRKDIARGATPITKVIERGKIYMKSFLESIAQGKTPAASNLFIVGESGTGKTDAVRAWMREVFDLKLLGEQFFTHPFTKIGGEEKKLSIGFMELDGGTHNTQDSVIPRMSFAQEPGPLTESYINKAKKASGSEKVVYENLATDTAERDLGAIIQRFFNEANRRKVDCIIIVVQDLNKNRDPFFNNFVKSLCDGHISSEKIPPAFLVGTLNPTKAGFINNPMCNSILTTGGIIHADLDLDALLKYTCAPYPKSGEFFRNNFTNNKDLILSPPPQGKERMVGSPSPRTWFSALTVQAWLENYALEQKDPTIKELLPDLIIPIIGEKAAMAYLNWLTEHSGTEIDYTLIHTDVQTLVDQITAIEAIDLQNVGMAIEAEEPTPKSVDEFIAALPDEHNARRFLLFWSSCPLFKEWLKTEKEMEDEQANALFGISERIEQVTNTN